LLVLSVFVPYVLKSGGGRDDNASVRRASRRYDVKLKKSCGLFFVAVAVAAHEFIHTTSSVKKGCDELVISSFTKGYVTPSTSIVSRDATVERVMKISSFDMSLNTTSR
jgi:hypothetical protein